MSHLVSLPVSISAPISKQTEVSMSRSAQLKGRVSGEPGEELKRCGSVQVQQDRKDTACSSQ